MKESKMDSQTNPFPFNGGWSNNRLELKGGIVIKYDPRSSLVMQWYNEAKDRGLKVPHIYYSDSSRIEMEYLKSIRPATVSDCNDELIKMRKLAPYTTFTYQHYIDRVATHCDYHDMFWSILPMLQQIPFKHNPPVNTFSHGDLNPDNLIVTERGNYLIDPAPYTFSSAKLDTSKMEAWLIRHDMFDLYDYNPLNIAETIRTIKYAPKEYKSKLITICLNYLRE